MNRFQSLFRDVTCGSNRVSQEEIDNDKAPLKHKFSQGTNRVGQGSNRSNIFLTCNISKQALPFANILWWVKLNEEKNLSLVVMELLFAIVEP
ncbi:hypothetical protein Hanom_Chr09g00770421 [Helianthus anomalus]